MVGGYLIAVGIPSPEIARQLNRHPQVIRQKAYDLGLSLKPQRETLEARCKLDRKTLAGLSHTAQRYGHATIAGLLRELLTTIVKDDLVSAVLDTPAPRAAKPERQRAPAPLPTPLFVAVFTPQLRASISNCQLTGHPPNGAI